MRAAVAATVARLRLRDEYDRLSWLEQQITELAAEWRTEAAALRAPDQAGGLTPYKAGQAAELDKRAAGVEELIEASRVPGAPEPDHLAWALHHLARLDAAARQAAGG